MVKLIIALFVVALGVANGQFAPAIEYSVARPEVCGRTELAGGLKKVRFGSCVEQPCNVSPNKEFNFDIDFTSSATYHGSELIVTIMGFGREGMTKIEIPKIFVYGLLDANSDYTMSFPISFPMDFEYTEFLVKVEINGMRFRLGPIQELCTYLNFQGGIIR